MYNPSYVALGDTNFNEQYFTVKGIKKSSKTSFGVAVITPSKVWKKVSVSYLVSSRLDLAVGSLVLDPYSSYNCGEQTYDEKL